MGRRGVMAATALTLGLGAWWALGLQAAPSPDVVDAQRGHVRALEAELTGIDPQASAAATRTPRRSGTWRTCGSASRDTGAALRETRAAHAVAVERLSDRLVAIYTGGEPPSLVEVLLTSGGLTEAVEAQSALESIGEADAALVSTTSRPTATASPASPASCGPAARRPRPTWPPRRPAWPSSRGSSPTGGRCSTAPGPGWTGCWPSSRAAPPPAARASGPCGAAGARAERALLRRADPGSGPAAPAASAPGRPRSGGRDLHPRRPRASVERGAWSASPSASRAATRSAVSSSGQYRGKYQFDLGTWQAVGGQGDPAAAPEAEQDRGPRCSTRGSGPAPWPVCGYQ